MENQAEIEIETPIRVEPREPARARHFHFRRRRVLWALGLPSTPEALIGACPARGDR